MCGQGGEKRKKREEKSLFINASLTTPSEEGGKEVLESFLGTENSGNGGGRQMLYINVPQHTCSSEQVFFSFSLVCVCPWHVITEPA